MKKWIVGLAAVGLLAGCSSNEPVAVETVTVTAAPTTTTPITTTTASPTTPALADMSVCSDATGEGDPAMRAAFGTLPPNPEVELVVTQSITHSDDRTMDAAIFYLCAPKMTLLDQKDFATTLAYALKQTAYADKVKTMSVYNFYGKQELGRMRSDFQIHTYDPKVDRGALRASWDDLQK